MGVKTYGLAGSIVNIAEYPKAFENCHAVDRGDGTFQIPEVYDGTIRHIPKGSTRELGTFEEDSLEDLNLQTEVVVDNSATLNTNNNGTHRHGINISNVFSNGGGNSGTYYAGGWQGGSTYVETLDSGNHSHSIQPHNHNAIATSSSSARQSEETRMKNTAGQWYLLLKVEI